MAAAEGDALELEAMRMDDHSWHPCHVSLSSGTANGTCLVVDFENNDYGYTLSNEEEASSCLRQRSIPLQDGACLHVKEGDNVLAMHKTQFRSLFFDAQVVKVQRVRHSSRVHCRCSFEIRWLHPELKGEILTVPSSAIRTLTGNGIHSHPTVSGFLKSLNNPNAPNKPMPSYVTHLEDSSCEIDIDRLVEGQIEEISKLVNTSDKPFSEEVLLGVKKVDLDGRTKSRIFISSQISSLPSNHSLQNQDNARRLTRSQRKQQTEKESKDIPVNQSTMEDLEMRSHLSPLAARAALASLMHELPQKPEISVYHIEKKGYVDPCRNPPVQHMDVHSVDVTRMYMNSDVCIQEKISTAGKSCRDDSLEVTQQPISAVSNPIQISNSNGSGESSHETERLESNRRGASKKMGKSTQMPTKKEKSTALQTAVEDADLVTPLVTRHTTIRRVTRSASREGLENSMDKFKLVSSTEDNKLNTSTIITGPDAVSSTNLLKQETSIEDSKSNGHTITRRVTRSTNQRDKEKANVEASPEPSSVRRKLNNPTIRNATFLANQKEMQKSNEEVNLESMKGGRFSDPITRRVTRLGNSIKEAKLESSSNDGKLDTLNKTTRVTCKATEEDIGKSIKEFNLEPITVNMEFDNPIMTRSSCSAIQKRTVNLIEKATQERPTKGRKLDYHSTRRFTRSSVQKELGNIVIDLESSAEDQTSRGPTITKRLTRSMVQKENCNSTDIVMQESSVEHGKFKNPSIIRVARLAGCRDMGDSVKEFGPAATRVTRSTSHRDMQESVKEVSPTITRLTGLAICKDIRDGGKEVSPTRRKATCSTVHKDIRDSVKEISPTVSRVTCSAICEDKEDPGKDVSCTMKRVTLSASSKNMGDSVKGNGPNVTRLTRSAMHKDMGDNVKEVSYTIPNTDGLGICKGTRDSVKKVCVAGATTMPYSSPTTRRVTRSQAQRQMESSTIEQDKGGEKRKLVQDTMALTNDSGAPVKADCRETKRKLLSLPVDIDRNSSQRGRKRMKVSSTVVIIIDDKDETSVGDEGHRSSKGKTAAKKPLLRFSHRLRFLPRTRSQAKRLLAY